MTTIEELEIGSTLNENEFESMTTFMFHSFAVHKNYKSASVLEKKIELLEDFISFVTKYLALKFTGSVKQKLELINFIDKLTMQKELIELQTGKLNMKDIKLAAKRLGKKSQSAFEGK